MDFPHSRWNCDWNNPFLQICYCQSPLLSCSPRPPPELGMKPTHAFHTTAALPTRTGARGWLTRSTFLMAFNAGLLLFIHRLLSVTGAQQADLFYLYYQPFAPFLVMLWLWGVNVRYFERKGIRYDVCFAPEEHKYLLPAKDVFQVRRMEEEMCCERGPVFFQFSETPTETLASKHSFSLARLILPWVGFVADGQHSLSSGAVLGIHLPVLLRGRKV